MVTDRELKQNIMITPVLLAIYPVGQTVTSYTGLQSRQKLFIFYFSPNATTCSYEILWFPSWLWR